MGHTEKQNKHDKDFSPDFSALFEKNSIYKLLFQKTNDAIFIHSTFEKGNISNFLEVNEEACSMLGYTKEELLNLCAKDLEVLTAGEFEKLRIDVERQYNEKNSAEFVSRLRTKWGGAVICEMRANLIEYEGNSFIVTFARDITSKRLYEEELELFRNLVDRASDAVFITEAPSGRIVLANNKLSDLTGYDNVVLLSMKADELFYGKTKDNNWTKILKTLETENSSVIEREVLCSNTDVILIEFSNTYVRLEEKSYVISFGRNISERKRIEKSFIERISYEEALFNCSKLLIKAPKKGIDVSLEVLKIILQATSSSRVYIVKNYYDNDNEPCFKITHEECRSGVFKKSDLLKDVPLKYDDGYRRWYKYFSSDKIIFGPIDALKESREHFIKAGSPSSVIFCPLFVGSSFYGFVGIEDTSLQKEWLDYDILLALTLTDMLSAYLYQKETEEAIRVERDRAKNYLNIAPVIFVILDSEGNIEVVNQGFHGLLGYKQSEVIGKNWFEEIVAEWNRYVQKKVFSNLLHHGEKEFTVCDVLKRDGDHIKVRWNIKKLYYENEEKVLLAGEDISAYEEFKDEIERQRGVFMLMLSATPDMIILKDLKKGLVGINEPALKYFGFNEKDILYKKDSELFSKEEAKKLAKEDREVISKNTQLIFEEEKLPGNFGYKETKISGKPVYFQKIKTPVRDEFGRIYAILITIRDITEIKNAELELVKAKSYLEEKVDKRTSDLLLANKLLQKEIKIRESVEKVLRENKDFLDSIVNNAPLLMWLKDRSRKFIMQNNYMENFTGTRIKLVGKTYSDLFSKEVATKFEIDEDIIFKTGKTIKREIEMEYGDKKYSLYTLRFPLYDEDKKPYAVCGIGADISELKHTEEALKAAKEKALEASMLKDEFLAYISHELRTSLSMININTEMILASPNINEKDEGKLDKISKAVDTAVKIIDEILDISKIEANKMVLYNIDFNLRDVIEETLESVNELADEKELKIHRKVRDIIVYSDEKRIKQILTNLLVNAIKYTDTGVIKVYCRKTRDNAIVVVKDTGRGIKSENLGKIFEPFFREDNRLHKRKGLGLGLSITKKIVTALGGEIEAQSKPGKGSIFKFTIPCNQNTESRAKKYFL